MSVATLIKQPAEIGRHLMFAGIDVAAVASVSAVGRGLVSGSAPIGATAQLAALQGGVVVELTGGTDGERYLVTVRAQDDAGGLHEAELDVAVLDATWAMPDGGVAYLTIAEFAELFGFEETVRMTDVSGTGRIDRSFLIAALRAAQGVANLNIAARYAVPIASVPDAVKTAIADIARARLYPNGAPDGVKDAAKDAVRMLERIASGALKRLFEAGDVATEAESDAPVLISPGERRYPKGGRLGW